MSIIKYKTMRYPAEKKSNINDMINFLEQIY